MFSTFPPSSSESRPPNQKSSPQANSANWLDQVTGIQYRTTNAYDPICPCFLVRPDAARQVDPAFVVYDLGAEGMIIRSVAKDLVLAGGRPWGTLNAVFGFLEDQIGCRWWSPQVRSISAPGRREPRACGPRFARHNLQAPLEYREPYWKLVLDGNWGMRNKFNDSHYPLTPEQGGRHVFEGFVHTFNRLIPPNSISQTTRSGSVRSAGSALISAPRCA